MLCCSLLLEDASGHYFKPGLVKARYVSVGGNWIRVYRCALCINTGTLTSFRQACLGSYLPIDVQTRRQPHEVEGADANECSLGFRKRYCPMLWKIKTCF